MAAKDSPKDLTTEEREVLGFVDDERVARVLGIGVPTLRNRRSAGLAPPSSKVGREHLTAISDLTAWIKRQRRSTRAVA